MTIFVQQLLGTIPGNFAALAALALFCALIGDAALGLLLPGFRRKRLCVALILGGDLMALAELLRWKHLPQQQFQQLQQDSGCGVQDGCKVCFPLRCTGGGIGFSGCR